MREALLSMAKTVHSETAREVGRLWALSVLGRIWRATSTLAGRVPRGRRCAPSNGKVIRHQPGRTARSTMHPHAMPSGSVLFSLAQAKEIGVGASLHLRPPGCAADAGVPQPGLPLCTLFNVDRSCAYDLQMVTWRRIREDCLQPTTDRVDISDGHLFPWWLMLGGTGRNRRLLDRGVTRVVASGRTLEVTLLDGEVVLYK